MSEEVSPYGGTAVKVETLSVEKLKALYFLKCGVDISEFLAGIDFVDQYKCELTGYKYWLPARVAGSEKFYQVLSKAWSNYYRTERWEYPVSASYVADNMSCIEIGSGRGFFLKSIESKCEACVGLEFNKEAIDTKVCASPVLNETVEEHVKHGKRYDIAFSFHVLEHITEPRTFLTSALDCLKPGGLLVISTPNDDFGPLRRMEDAFNLPPHHVGGYNSDVFGRVAQLLGVKLISTVTQPCPLPPLEVTGKTAATLKFRLFNKFYRTFGPHVYDAPGLTVLAIFRKSS